MRNHLGRTLLIIATLIATVIALYPTIGWYRLSEEEQNRRLETWRKEEIDLRREGAGAFTRLGYTAKKWAQFDRDMVINLGLDLQGGVLLVVGFDMTPEMEARGLKQPDVQNLVLRNIENRIEQFEAKEPLVQKLGTNQIQIQLPGQKDIQRAKDLITKTAKLEFHIVAGRDETVQLFRKIDQQFKNGFVPFLEAPLHGGPFQVEEANYQVVKQVLEEAQKVPGLIPADRVIAVSGTPKEWENNRREIYVMEKEAKMTGEGLKEASPATDQNHPGSWMIIFSFGGDAATKFATLTEENIGRQMAIVVDGNVVSAPTIQMRIPGTGNITGNFTGDEAKDLAIALNSGLPVPVHEEYAAIVGASIGQEAVRAGVVSALASLAVVALFMLAWYRLAGILAVISLAVNALLILAAFAYFDITLTLPGIAGLVLTIGMAVDSNVLIYERIREELAHGKSLSNAIHGGFEHAASAIFDSNVTHLIAALVLTQFGTGAIQGFAIALAIGVASTLFGAMVITRAMLEFLDERKLIQKLSMANVIPLQNNFNFMSRRHLALGLSIFVIVAGIVTFVVRGENNFGVDFISGTNARVHIEADNDVADAAVRESLTKAGFVEPVVQSFTQSGDDARNTFLIRVTETKEVDNTPVSDRIQNALLTLSKAADAKDNVKIRSLETVGPAVGGQLRADALNAVFVSLGLVILYLWFRFEWRFSLGAVVATFHDVVAVVGIFAILQEKITIPVVAAILTIVGYSLNDTIVIFDRVREDMALNRSKGMSFLEGLNISLNRTLSRTILTSLLTLFVVIVLYFTGGPSLQPFSLAMILGIVVGTYSSIFIACPVVLAWQNWREKRAARPVEQKRTRTRAAQAD